LQNYVQTGDIVEITAPYNVASGAGALVGNLFGVATGTALSGEQVNIKTTGIVDVAKVSAQAWSTVGLEIYWDNSAKLFTTTASTNKLVGVNVATAANPTATGMVRLNGIFGVPSAAQMAAGDA
jgi:predicted RecA/RadA family phage recombinase